MPHDKYVKGDGPEYVTLGKFGPNIGITEVTQVLRLNNICNDLGLDTASTGSAIAWAMELYQRGIITSEQTQLDLDVGQLRDDRAAAVHDREARRHSATPSPIRRRPSPTASIRAEALDYLMAVKGPDAERSARCAHPQSLRPRAGRRDARHGPPPQPRHAGDQRQDQRRSPSSKRELYGGPVSAEPNSYEGKEIAVRRCENIYAVGDSVGMCRFTTKLFNSPSLPGYEEFADQVANVTGIELTDEAIDQIGLNIDGRRAPDQRQTRRHPRGRHAAQTLVRRSDRRRRLQRREDRPRPSSTTCSRRFYEISNLTERACRSRRFVSG